MTILQDAGSKPNRIPVTRYCELFMLLTLVVVKPILVDKVWMYEEIMTNDDNLESNLLTSSLLKKTSGLHAGTC